MIREPRPKGHQISFRVRYYETDAMGIVHHSNYLRWFELGRTEYLRNEDIPYRMLEEKGISSPVIGINCKYHSPAKYDDEITVITRVKEYHNTKLTMSYEVKCGERILCSGESSHAFLLNNRPIAPIRSLPDLHVVFEKCKTKDCEKE